MADPTNPNVELWPVELRVEPATMTKMGNSGVETVPVIALTLEGRRMPEMAEWATVRVVVPPEMARQNSSAVVTLQTYAHLWPGDDERTRTVIDAALDVLRTSRGPTEAAESVSAGQEA